MNRGMLAALLLLWAAPVTATPTTEPVPPSAETVAQEMTAYGAWMARLLGVIQPVQAELGGLRGAWQEAIRAGPREGARRFRAYIERTEAAFGRADVALRSFDTPSFAALDLAEDLRPASMVRDMLRLNQESRVMVRSFLPLIDSIGGNDPHAMNAAAGEMMRSIRVVLDSQIMFARASIAGTDPESAMWEVGHIQLLFFRSMQRALSAWPNAMRGAADTGLAGDLEQMARELDGHAESGSAKNQAEIARLGEEVQQLGEGDGAARRVMRQAAAVYGESENYFGLGRNIAASLRNGAAIARRGPLTINTLGEIMSGISQWRPRFDEIARQESAIMARAN